MLNGFKYLTFFIKDEKMLKVYNKIWDRINNKMQNLGDEPMPKKT